MPYNSLGSVPVYECLKRGITVYAVKENSTALDVTKSKLFSDSDIVEASTYEKVLDLMS